MKTLLAPLALCAFACAPPATPEACQKACQRVAELQTAPARKTNQIRLHEIDEKVERMEDEVEARIAALKSQLAEPPPKPDPKALRKLTAKARKGQAERAEWEARQLKLQRELALKREEESLAQVKKQYVDTKAEMKTADEKLLSDAVAACAPSCGKKGASYAECLQKAQAVEDLDLCASR